MSQTPVLNYCLQGLDFSNSSGSHSLFPFFQIQAELLALSVFFFLLFEEEDDTVFFLKSISGWT